MGAGNDRTFRGVSARIFNWDPTTYPYRWAQAYARLDKLGTTYHAHVGWYDTVNVAGTHKRWTYVEWKKGANYSTTFAQYNPKDSWTFSEYSVEHNGGNPGTVTFKVDGNTVRTESGMLWVPDGAEINGHTSTAKVQMPGGYNLHEHFDGAQIKIGSTWSAFNGPITQISNSTYHGAQQVSTVNFDVWDKYCPLW